MAVSYRYELLDGDDIIATGRLSRDESLNVGERIEVAGRTGTVQTIQPILGDPTLRLVVQLDHHLAPGA